MIIRSRLPQSPALYRLTRLSDPASIPLNQVLQNLSSQWGIEPTPNFAILVKFDDSKERLVIDKQIEWDLFLEENIKEVVEIEIVDGDFILDQSTSVIRKKTSAPKPTPKYPFNSVEPQATRPPKDKEDQHTNPVQSQAQNLKQESQTEPVNQVQSTLSLDEIMERSRRQGESLNQLFGTMQARRAGRTSQMEDEKEASGPALTQEVTAEETSQNQEEAGPSSSSQRRTTADVGKVNDYLQNVWQERLSQMGHGPNSGSPYAKLRTGKIQNIPSDLADHEANQSETYKGSSSSSEIIPTSAMMAASASTSGPRELHGITEEMVSSNNRGSEELIVFPSSVSAQPSPQIDSVGADRMTNQEDYITAGNAISLNRSLRSSLFKSKLFKHRRGSSDLFGSMSTTNMQSSGRETPEGARTPQSFNSSIFKRRPLSVRSLSDALIRSSRERGNTGASSSSSLRPAIATSGNVTPVQSHTSSRHRVVRSLSDFQFLSLPPRRRRNGSSHSVPVSNSIINPIMLSDQGQDTTAGQNNSLGITIPQNKDDATPQQSKEEMENKVEKIGANSIARDGKTIGPEIGRPSLLRASHSTPLSSTAINLSSAGGITLHASSVGDPSFTWIEKSKDFTTEGMFHTQKPARNLFDIMLPREIQLDCLRSLIELHQDEAVMVRNLSSSQMNAAKRRGKVNGMRELVRLSRVSRTWQSLMLDGQLWSTLDASTAHGISDECLKRIVRTSGSFIKNLNMRNMQNVSSQLLMDITSPPSSTTSLESLKNGRSIPGVRQRSKSAIRLPSSALIMCNFSLPSLTNLNLQGCRSIGKEALHYALVRLPQLEHLNVSNLTAVNNETLLILGASVPKLKSIDVSRCIFVTGDGLMNFIDAAQGSLYDQSLFKKGGKLIVSGISEIALELQELRASGLRDIDVSLMNSMGRAMRNLRTLDLSYSTDLSDEAIAAFVRHPGPPIWSSMKELGTKYSSMKNEKKMESLFGPYVSLSAREAGGNILSDDQHYRRLHVHLQHLILSSCRSLTDRSFVHLAHALPQLRFLELANVGNGLHDAGLVKLLETTPKIERVDVEGAIELGDKFIQALTPSESYLESIGVDLSTTQDSTGTIPSSRNTNAIRGNSFGRIGRRTLRRSRQESNEDTVIEGQVIEIHQVQPFCQSSSKIEPATGAKLTHLIISHLNKVDPSVLLTLVRRCPKLIHLEVDDTRANDALLNEFISLAKQRKSFGAYISLVDCRALSKSANGEVFASGHARPRAGQVGEEFQHFHYEGGGGTGNNGRAQNTLQSIARSGMNLNTDSSNSNDSDTLTSANTHSKVPGSSLDECDESLIVVKTFWAWQAVDVRNRIRKRAEAKRAAMMAKLQGKNGALGKVDGSLRSAGGKVRDPLAAALSFISNGGLTDDDDLEEGQGRWSRITTGILGPNDEGEDARGCTVM